MPLEIVPLVFVSLTVAFVVIQLGKTRLRGVVPLVAGIGAAVFSYTRYSLFAGLLDQPAGMFDSQITYLQYFWLGSILLWIAVAGWGLTRVLSAPSSGGAGSLREHEKTVRPTPTDEEVANDDDSVLTMDAWGPEDDVIVEKTVDPRSDVDLWPSELGPMQNWRLRVIRILIGSVAGAVGGGLIAALPLVLLSMGARGEGAAWGVLFAIAAGVIGASVGAVVGGVTAHTTTGKGEGASLGALLGAATAAIVVVALSMTGSYFDVSVLVGAAALGAMVGAATGFLGSVVARHTSAADIHDERRGR
jgi:hypothetical protein